MKPEDFKRYYVKSYGELFELINRRLHSVRAGGAPSAKNYAKAVLLAKLNTVYSVLNSELSEIVELLNSISSSHEFYREIFELETSVSTRELAKLFAKLRRNARKIYLEHKLLVEESGEEIAANHFRAGVARLLSIYKRKSKAIESIRRGLFELKKLPDVSGSYVAIIAGMPQVGKSTLLSKLTRAKPEISPFPFTTKTVVVGHVSVDGVGKITLIDTPGLLDRPVDLKNAIELKAVTALKRLADIVLYVFDVSDSSYYSFEEQLNVFESVASLVSGVEIVALLNKVDAATSERVSETSSFLLSKYGCEPICISALTGYNLDLVRDLLINKFMERIQRLQR